MIPLSIKYTRYRIDENALREMTEKHRPKQIAQYDDHGHAVRVFEARYAEGITR